MQSVDDGVFVNADGDIDIGAVSAADNFDVIALGSVTLGTVANDNTSALFTANIRGTSVSATSIDVTGLLNLEATGGSIDVTGAITTGSNTDIDADINADTNAKSSNKSSKVSKLTDSGHSEIVQAKILQMRSWDTVDQSIMESQQPPLELGD